MPNLSYLHLGEEIDRTKHIIATFRIESVLSLEEAASEIAAESSIGTWTKVGTMNEKIFAELSAKVFEIKNLVSVREVPTLTSSPSQREGEIKRGREIKPRLNVGLVKIAYPVELFEDGNIPQLLSSVAGNIFSMKKINNLRLEDLEFPEVYVKTFKGPALGLSGIRELTDIKERPLIGSIIKPKMGLSAKEHAKVAYDCFIGGVDLVKDDENLTSQSFNNFKERVKETLKLAKKAEKETGSKKICAFNVTAETSEMIKRAKFIKRKSGYCAMADIMTLGFGAVQSLRNANLGLIIHGHRAMHSAMTRNPYHGISMLVIAKLARLAGIDQLHTGTVVGKMDGGETDVLAINNFLKSEWFGLKPVLPIASGGLYPGLVPELMKILGNDLIINFGGGIHGHPDGTLSGVRAARQAVDAATQGDTLENYAKDKDELKKALEKWN